ncbi:MAG TPA: hypothetical protein VEZ70_08380 [Allosphingosinicella sp.]|nr:hypothetical protein [Allosphingosinicella sp.]
MPVGRAIICGSAALAAVSGGLVGSLAAASPAPSAMPPLAWQNAGKLQILCTVVSDRFGERESLEAQLCARTRALAAKNSPVAVQPLAFGDPALIDPANITLLLHASVQQPGAERLLVFNIRAYRAGGVETDILFGAVPRAVTLSDAEAFAPALDAALSAALSETLPWHGAR